MSAILDRGSLLFASAAVLAVSLLIRFPISFYTPLLVLAAVYVPGTVFLSKLLSGQIGSSGSVFQRDYAPLLTCSGMAWTAANLPVALASWVFPGPVAGFISGLAYLYFAVLMFFAV